MKILNGCQLGITSMSLGWAKAGHTLEDKLRLAKKYGYKGIELFHDDLDDVAARRFMTDMPSGTWGPSDPGCRSPHRAQLAAAKYIRDLCDELGIAIICLQPFLGYEGLLDRDARAAKLAKLRRWFELAHELETDTIQIPSSFESADKMTENMDIIVQDLQRVADMGYEESPRLNFVFEALCFGTRCDTWEKSWEVVKRVDRGNFGLCLDSFNIAGRIYADPTKPDGKNDDAMRVVVDSLKKLVREVDPKKIFYVQIVDAALLSKPLVKGHELHNEQQPPRMSWSRSCRLFYGEQDRGAYLPIRMIAHALFVELGFKGWVSLELFNARMSDEGAEVREELAYRGAVSWEKLKNDIPMFLEEDNGPLPILRETRTSEDERNAAALKSQKDLAAMKSQKDLLAMLDPILPRKSSKDEDKEAQKEPESSKDKGKEKEKEPEVTSPSPSPSPKNSEERYHTIKVAPFKDEVMERLGVKKTLYTPPSGSPHPGSLKAPSDVISPRQFEQMQEEQPQPPPEPEPQRLRKLMSAA